MSTPQANPQSVQINPVDWFQNWEGQVWETVTDPDVDVRPNAYSTKGLPLTIAIQNRVKWAFGKEVMRSVMAHLARARALFHDRDAKFMAASLNLQETRAVLQAIKDGQEVDIDAEIRAIDNFLDKASKPWVR